MDQIIKYREMRKYRLISLLIAFIIPTLNAFCQQNDEFERIINLDDAMSDIDFYVFKHKDFTTQLDLIEQYISNNNPIVRRNCYLWLSFIGQNDTNSRNYIVEKLLEGLDDSVKNVVDVCYSRLIQVYNRNDFTVNGKQKVRDLFNQQVQMFYIVNTFVNTEDKREKDSCWAIYKSKPFYYDVTKLIGYLGMSEMIPTFNKVLTDFKGHWGYNYADYPLMENPIEDYAESRIINPWNVHLALAHMGDTNEINYCIKQFNLVVEKNINNPDMIFDPFMKDMVYIMQPPIIQVILKMLSFEEVDEYYLLYVKRCFGNLIINFPLIGAEQDIKNEIINWLEANQNMLDLNRLGALKWDDIY